MINIVAFSLYLLINFIKNDIKSRFLSYIRGLNKALKSKLLSKVMALFIKTTSDF